MHEPITAVISAIAFVVVAILIISFLIKEGIKHFSQHNDNNKNLG